MSKGRVLAVDDEGEILKMLEEFLSLAGYDSFLAPSAAEALRILDEEAIDLLLADIRMPGMNGLELVRLVTEKHTDTDVIFMTAYGSVEIAVEAMKLGAFDFVQKPFRIETLDECLLRCFERRALRREVHGETDERRVDLLERKMKELSSLKNEFIAITSHELLTPLTPLDGYLQVLRDGTLGELKPEQIEAIDVMIAEILRLKILIRNLLTLRDLAGGTRRIARERVDLVPLIEDAIHESASLASDRKVTLRTDLPAACVIESDGSLLLPSFAALVHNAVKFTKGGGQIEVGLDCQAEGVGIVFRDDGIGIADEEREAIFEEFYQVDRGTTRRYGGVGIGLTLVRRVCKALDGRVEVSSESGRGSVFRIILPGPCLDC